MNFLGGKDCDFVLSDEVAANRSLAKGERIEDFKDSNLKAKAKCWP